MLTNLNALMQYAQEHKMAIGSFNGPTLESARAAVEAAQELGVPLILQHAPAHDPYISLELAGKIMLALAEQATVPVCVHLDHGHSLETVMRAIRTGYTSVMYDASGKPFEQNLQETRKIVRMAHAVNVSVEAELGNLPHNFHGEMTDENPEAFYTNPEDARRFVKETGVDALAIAFGTVHGVYKAKPKLSFDVIRRVREATGGLPLVMHGGSGLSDEDYRTAIACGIRKINYYTYGVKYAGEAVQQVIADFKSKNADANVYWHDMTMAAYQRLYEDFTSVIKVFANGADPVA